MKTKLIVILCLLIVKISFGQNYRSFSADTTIWWAESKNTVEEGSLCTRQFTYLFGDTVFNALHYKKIYQSNYYYYSFAEARTDLANKWQFKGYLRDDIPNKKVYFSPSTVLGILNSEQLLYDFNLQIGDTLPHSYIYRNQHQTISGIAQKLTVSGINNITINGIAHKRYFFAGLNNQTAYITEAIGTSVGLIDPLAMSQNTYPVLTKKVMLNNWNAQDFIVLNKCTFCPSYKQFPTGDAQWFYKSEQISPYEYNEYNYIQTGDTLIKGKLYKKVYSYSYSYRVNNNKRNEYCSKSIWNVLRSDSINKILFKYDFQKNREQLVFNFNAKVGAKFETDSSNFFSIRNNTILVYTPVIIRIEENDLFTVTTSGTSIYEFNIYTNQGTVFDSPITKIVDYVPEFRASGGLIRSNSYVPITHSCFVNSIMHKSNKYEYKVINTENGINIYKPISTVFSNHEVFIYDYIGTNYYKNIFSSNQSELTISLPKNHFFLVIIKDEFSKMIYSQKIITF